MLDFLLRLQSQSEVELVRKPCSTFLLFLPSFSNYQNQDDLRGQRIQSDIVVANVR